MLEFWRAYRSPILFWVFFFGTGLGLTVLNPVYVNVCKRAETGGGEECEPRHIVIAALYKLAEILSHAETWTALATIAIAAFTYTLKRSTDKLWTAGERQFDLARQEFRSTHRPRMRLKHAWFTDQTAWRLNGPLEINLDFVNIGSGPARTTWILYQSVMLEPGQRLPQKPPYDEVPLGPDIRISRFRSIATLPSGVTLAREVCDGILDPWEVQDILWGKRQLFIIGTIEYWDLDGAGLRQTAFCRRLIFANYPPAAADMGRFEIVQDPDYEYED
jgi:hypothetical protein